jgi:anti-sigma regulatory factor (Ser/Thr protein kinase)
MEKKLVIKNDISEISKLATFIGELSEELDLTPELNFNLNLVLEEAVSNVILYAYGKEEQKDISLVAYLSDNNLVFVLTDSGMEFDPTKVPDADVTLSAEEREIGGLGIYLIRQIMNTVEYQRIDGKNVLTMRKELN